MSVAREMTRWEQFVSNIRHHATMLRRRFPHLVWSGQEVDVGVTFANDPLFATEIEDAFRQLYNGRLHDAEHALADMGVTFDKGMGFGGRDWEWDWSLKGPVSVRFRCRASEPENRNRLAPPK